MYGISKYDGKVAKGSVQDVAQQQGRQIEDVMMEVDAVIIVDTSGSMASSDEQTNSRYERAVSALEYYQQEIPGKILVVSFSSDAKFCLNGYPDYQGGGTDMTRALQFVHLADSIKGMNFILISDGQPDSEVSALSEARKYQNKINTVFIGSENGYGRDFLKKLSNATGGQSVVDFKAMNMRKALKEVLLLT